MKEDVCLASISGGTDIASCFALGSATLPVWRGELQCRGLGMDVDIFDEEGAPVSGTKGELVCKSAFPAMPAGFWGDPDGAEYRATYFERYPGVWRQGDWAELTEHGGVVIYGRSDATLNPGGVRMGTAEIYHQVEPMPEIVECLAIGQAWPPGECTDARVVLFVKLQDGLTLDEALAERIRQHDRGEHHAAPRAREDRAGQRHSAHAQRQDRGARRKRCRARARRAQHRGAGESRGARPVSRPAKR